LPSVEAWRAVMHAGIGASLEGLGDVAVAVHCGEAVQMHQIAASKARCESSNHGLRMLCREADAALAGETTL
jgi:hypothetical protein